MELPFDADTAILLLCMDPPLPSPAIDMGVDRPCPSDWPSDWRGSVGGRASGLVPCICDICDICDMPVQRVSLGWNVQSGSFMFIAPNGDRPWDGSRAPGVRNTFVVFFLFFHLARRFWNQT